MSVPCLGRLIAECLQACPLPLLLGVTAFIGSFLVRAWLEHDDAGLAIQRDLLPVSNRGRDVAECNDGGNCQRARQDRGMRCGAAAVNGEAEYETPIERRGLGGTEVVSHDD